MQVQKERVEMQNALDKTGEKNREGWAGLAHIKREGGYNQLPLKATEFVFPDMTGEEERERERERERKMYVSSRKDLQE